MGNTANQIELFKQTVPLYDEKLHQDARTGVLDGETYLMREGANADELIVSIPDTDGLAPYDRANGFTRAAVRTTAETIKCNFDRGAQFMIDYIDNVDTQNTLLNQTIKTFMEEHVIPEVDAFRFSKYAQTPGATCHAPAAIASGEEGLKRLRAGVNTLDKNSVPKSGRYLFITSTLKGDIDDLNNTTSRRVLDGFEEIIEVEPQRFYSAINQTKNGYEKVTESKQETFQGDSSKKEFVLVGEEKTNWVDEVTVGGKKKVQGKDYTYDADTHTVKFTTAPGAETIVVKYGKTHDLNFMIVYKPSVIQYAKHVMPQIIEPQYNNSAYAWLYGYRNVGIAQGWKNKAKGIYADLDEN